MPHIHDLYDFTSSAYILHPDGPKIALHLHKKFNSWMQMGGHIELHEDPEEALAHEILEEAGLEADQYEYIQLYDQPSTEGYKQIPLPINVNVHPIKDKTLTNHKHIDFVFLIKSKTDKLQPQVGESQEIDWFTKEEIEQLRAEDKVMPGNYETCMWIFSKIDKKVIG